MASARLKLTAVLESDGFLRALGISVALFVVSAVAIAEPQPGAATTALLTNSPAVPTTIKHAPFSAQLSTEYDRVLVNGNHIHRETRGNVFRDAQGRVRTETRIQSVGGVDSSERIAIQDPVLREVIHLDAKTRTAYVHHLAEAFPLAAAAGNTTVTNRPGNIVVASPRGNQADGTIAVPLHPVAIKPPSIEFLGTRILEGVQVIGTRTTRVIPDGNNEPIVAVSDLWFSRDLQMVILSVSDDGQGGHSLMRVTNIVRSSPKEQLFQVPPDYTVRDGNPMAAVVKR
jgi:hypothetical protein